MVILEGPDGGGKTTLAKRLCENLDLTYMRPPKDVLSSESGPVDPERLADWWFGEISEAKDGNRNFHVYDRSTYISDPIYRLMFGDKSGSSEGMMHRGINHIVNYELICFCLPGFELARQAVADHTRENLRLPDEQRHEVLYWAYECQYHLWWEVMVDKCLRYDWENYEEIREEVRQWVY